MKLLTKSIGVSLIALSINSFASLQQCMDAGNQKNYSDTIKYCKPLADSDRGALMILAGIYATNHKDSEAVKYFKIYINKYSNSNDRLSLAAAYTALGSAYYYGQGVSTNRSKGINYFTKGANLGSSLAQYQLGSFYGVDGTAGVNKNYVNNFYWTTVSALNGNSEADKFNLMKSNYATFKKQYPYCIALGQDMVGVAYYQGKVGLNKSTSTAVTWLEKAHDSDPSLSIVNLDLAKMQQNNGNDSAAFKAASNAVSQPYAPAFQYLGTMYLEGTGTSKDMVKAYAYLKVAEYYYNNPDKAFWEKFKAPCRPNYAQIPSGFGLGVLKQELGKIELNAEQKTQAEKLIGEIKGKVKT